MGDSFYKGLEDEFRGAREVIKSRLRVYYPFVCPLTELYENTSALDLGCGRGEWLELMAEIGIQNAIGVDIDEEMTAPARARGLKIVKGSAVDYLRRLPDASQHIVSAFHLVEHLEFSEVQALFEETHRVIAPGGLLILETPNPENLVVGTSNFYIDPTHKRPMPPPLLGFLSERCGFARAKLVRLQGHESTELAERRPMLRDVLWGVSQDYAIIGQKGGSEAAKLALADAFALDFGVGLEEAAQEYDRLFLATINRLNNRVVDLEYAVSSLKANAHIELAALYRSRSWRFTYPMRVMGRILRAMRRKQAFARVKTGLAKAPRQLAPYCPLWMIRLAKRVYRRSLASNLPQADDASGKNLDNIGQWLSFDKGQLNGPAMKMYEEIKRLIAGRAR